MVQTLPIQLSSGRVRASVRADEGGVVEQPLVDGRSALSRTPWADTVVPSAAPAPAAAAWVARWRGGWQLCFPSAGLPDDCDPVGQGFHGTAPQAPWHVVRVDDGRVTLSWDDALGLSAERTWRLTDDGIEARTSVVNAGDTPRGIVVAEHLVLGGDTLAPVARGSSLTLEVPGGSVLAPLDYMGRPGGSPAPWPGRGEERWDTVDATTPARVAALMTGDGTPGPRRVTVRGPHVEATVAWSGLPHALLWEELGASPEPPWNGAVVALGIEPTSTPHGAGTGAGHGIVTLDPGARMTWQAALVVRWVAA